MKNKFVITAVLFLIVLLFNCSGGRTSKGKVVLSPKSIDLGIIESKQKINISFELVNDSDEKRKIVSKAQSCGCTKMKMTSETIRPYQRLKINLIFDPKNEFGQFEKSAFIRLDNNEILILKFHGKTNF